MKAIYFFKYIVLCIAGCWLWYSQNWTLDKWFRACRNFATSQPAHRIVWKVFPDRRRRSVLETTNTPGENFCAGYTNGTSTCQGDSGGGIAIKVNGRWFLRGIVSFGVTRKGYVFCNPNTYSVFLDVAHYLEWIENNIEATRVVSITSSIEYYVNHILQYFSAFCSYSSVLVMLLISIFVLALSLACVLTALYSKRTESSVIVPFYANPQDTSSQAKLIW